MYNRYIPQPDGSYHRSRQPDKKPVLQQHAPPLPAAKPPEPTPSPPQQSHACQNPPPKPNGKSGFLRQLLPKDFDTGDLIIILLLLLIAGDREEERSFALLTIALYLIM